MTVGQLNADVEQYLQAAASNTPPPIITSDPVVAGVTPVEQWMAVLTAAANLSDATDNARSAEEHAERDAKVREAAEKFAAQDEHAATEFKSITAEPHTLPEGSVTTPGNTATMSQQVPQWASGIAGALAGAVGGALQPLAQLPQQAGQGIHQAIQAGMGLLQQAAGEVALPLEDADLAATPLDEDFGVDAGGIGTGSDDGLDGLDGLGAGGLGISGGLGVAGGALGPLNGTAPTGYLGPPPIPPSSVGTAPSSAPITSITAPGPAVAHPPGATGMAGMPIVPPGALGAAAKSDQDDKADTKRLSVPPVRNGAPVQGRLTVPPEPPPVVNRGGGQPVVTRRIGDADGVRSARPDSGS